MSASLFLSGGRGPNTAASVSRRSRSRTNDERADGTTIMAARSAVSSSGGTVAPSQTGVSFTVRRGNRPRGGPRLPALPWYSEVLPRTKWPPFPRDLSAQRPTKFPSWASAAIISARRARSPRPFESFTRRSTPESRSSTTRGNTTKARANSEWAAPSPTVATPSS